MDTSTLTTSTGRPLERGEAIEIVKLLKSLIAIGDVKILRNTFIKAFKEKSIPKADGRNYLHGNFNLGGTVSGRMSSNKPNLQNLPSTGTTYAKAFKECFSAPDGWLLVGADFASLEDRIAALTTKDRNKLKVYMGHTVYKITIDNTVHHIRDDDIVSYDGKEYTGEEFYVFFNSYSTP